MVDELKKMGMMRLVITGGEPMVLGDDLFEFMKYVHSKKTHSVLSTTGLGLTQEVLQEMDAYVDQLQLSIRSFRVEDWIEDFGETKHTQALYNTVFQILHWAKKTEIFIEI